MTVVMAAACSGPAVKPDSGGGDARSIDGPPDADTSVDGTWLDTYYTASGPVMSSACAGPQAILVDPSNGTETTYPGTCQVGGAFKLATPASVTSYYLRAQGSLFATTAHAGLDLSTDHLGRSDIAGISNVNLSLNLTNLETWATGDLLMAFSANVGFFESLVFTSGTPINGDTSVTAIAPWYGYAIDASMSDVVQIVQLGVHQTAGGVPYDTLDRAYSAAPFTMTANTTSSIPATGSDAFVAPTTGTLHLAIDIASFDGYAAAATPSTNARSIAATEYAAVSPAVIPSPSLFTFSHDSSNLATIDFGVVSFGDPFPSQWQRRVRVAESFQVPYTFNAASGTMIAEMSESVPVAVAQQEGTVAASLGPVTSFTIDGMPAFSGTGFIASAPLIAWAAPALGTPTDYEVTVFEANASGTLLTFAQTVTLTTKTTSVRVPAGIMLPQRQYVVRVRARNRNADFTVTPFHLGSRTITADALSALWTTQ